jgi:hypothetical protein
MQAYLLVHCNIPLNIRGRTWYQNVSTPRRYVGNLRVKALNAGRKTMGAAAHRRRRHLRRWQRRWERGRLRRRRR